MTFEELHTISHLKKTTCLDFFSLYNKTLFAFFPLQDEHNSVNNFWVNDRYGKRNIEHLMNHGCALLDIFIA